MTGQPDHPSSVHPSRHGVGDDGQDIDADDHPRRMLTEVIGSGPKTADDLSYDEAHGAFSRILAGGIDPTTLGAFLLANRWKENTPVELAGFIDAMRERVSTSAPSVDPVDCGANYDGKDRTALLGVASGLAAAAAGTPVVVHSAGRVPTSRGCTYRHVLDCLGIQTAVSPAESAEMVDAIGFGYYDATRFNPAIHDLLDRREAMGVRTAINTIETLANPAAARVHLGSFFHTAFAERVVKAVQESRSLEFSRVVMVQGLEGYDDVRPGSVRGVRLTDGDHNQFEFKTAALGLDCAIDDLAVDTVAEDSARLTDAVLSGRRDDHFADAVRVNAAIRIWARGDAESIDTAVEMADVAIASGDAAVLLDQLRSFADNGKPPG